MPPAMNPRFNSDGLPIRPGQMSCSYYMNTRDCDYGKARKWHHPEFNSVAADWHHLMDRTEAEVAEETPKWARTPAVLGTAKGKDQGKMVWKLKNKPEFNNVAADWQHALEAAREDSFGAVSTVAVPSTSLAKAEKHVIEDDDELCGDWGGDSSDDDAEAFSWWVCCGRGADSVIIFVILLVMFGLLTHDQWLGTWDTAAAVCRADGDIVCHPS